MLGTASGLLRHHLCHLSFTCGQTLYCTGAAELPLSCVPLGKRLSGFSTFVRQPTKLQGWASGLLGMAFGSRSASAISDLLLPATATPTSSSLAADVSSDGLRPSVMQECSHIPAKQNTTTVDMQVAFVRQSTSLCQFKSVKRRAAELLLAARYSPTGSPSNVMSVYEHVQTSSTAQQPYDVSPQQGERGSGEMQAAAPCMTGPPTKRPRLHHSPSHPGSSLSGRATGQLQASCSYTTLAQSGGAVATPVTVPACPPSCICSSSGWCTSDVRLHHINWERVFQEPPGKFSHFMLSQGYDKYFMCEGLQVYMVQNPRHVADALAKLKASMTDPFISIDLEWKPETESGSFNKVALMQLSSATVCVLLHTSAMSFTLPDPARDFLEDPAHVLVGFAWDSADEAKFSRSFDLSRKDFGRFIDLQVVAFELGYQRPGLARLTKQVLGLTLNKSKGISRSNWASRSLSAHQIKYAALDVFATGQVFRGLRLWHSSPSPCPGCLHPVGQAMPQPDMSCVRTGQRFNNIHSYQVHCSTTNQTPRAKVCETCNRLVPLGEPDVQQQQVQQQQQQEPDTNTQAAPVQSKGDTAGAAVRAHMAGMQSASKAPGKQPH